MSLLGNSPSHLSSRNSIADCRMFPQLSKVDPSHLMHTLLIILKHKIPPYPQKYRQKTQKLLNNHYQECCSLSWTTYSTLDLKKNKCIPSEMVQNIFFYEIVKIVVSDMTIENIFSYY